MEKEKLIDIFLKKGLMVDSESLDFFSKNPEQVNIFLERIKDKEKPSIIKLDFVRSLLKTEPEIKEIKKNRLEKKIFSIDDISRILLERYEKIKSFFSYRMDIVNLISINKISEKTRKFSLIVMVREFDKKNKTAVVEDITGETTVFSPNDEFNFLVQDEVLGLVCEKNNDRIEVLKILWPDIPLKREIATLEENIYCIFLSSQTFFEKEEKLMKKISELKYKQIYIFPFFCSYNKKEVENLRKELPLNMIFVPIFGSKVETENTLFSTPVFLTIKEKVKLLFSDGRKLSSYDGILGEKTEEIMLNLLKKRHLDPVFSMEKAMLEDFLLIDPVPDIFVSFNSKSSGLVNYKGVTIISCGSSEQICWIVNLKTRESLKIDLT